MSALVAGLPATGTAQAAPRPAQAVPRPARAVPRPARAGELASPLSLLTGAGNRGELFGVKILSPAEGWAVGLYDVPGGTGAEHTLIEH